MTRLSRLVLERKPQERILIRFKGSLIILTLAKTSKSRALLVFDAPPEVEILRSELVNRPKPPEPPEQ